MGVCRLLAAFAKACECIDDVGIIGFDLERELGHDSRSHSASE